MAEDGGGNSQFHAEVTDSWIMQLTYVHPASWDVSHLLKESVECSQKRLIVNKKTVLSTTWQIKPGCPVFAAN